MKPDLSVVPSNPPPIPYPADTSTGGFRFELDLKRLMQSDTWALAGEPWRSYLLRVWAESWLQIPAGSFTNDDAVIAARIGMEPRTFAAHRDILLRGFRQHQDGRLYHPVIVEQVLEVMRRRKGTAERMRRHRGGESRAVSDTSVTRHCGVTYANDHDQDHKASTPASQESPVAVANGTPYAAIRDLWIEILPTLTRPMPVEYWTEARKVQLRNRWKDQLPTIESWRKCFERIRRSPFLMGKTSGRDGKPFKCDLFWIIKPENLLKLYEGKYDA